MSLLVISGYSYPKKAGINPNGKDVFIKGKITEEELFINFWLEGDSGSYALVFYNANDIKLIYLVNKVLKEEVSSSLEFYKINNYFVIEFDNKKIINMKNFKLVSFALKKIKILEKETNSKITGRVIFENL